ncbi:MAG: fructosamine kinase family protein [Chloroflexi bacterium]|nr:fructosamine kinase family protein [Chloroflexota bacterium]
MFDDLLTTIETALGVRPEGLSALSGGCIGDVYRVHLPGGESAVAKVADGQGARLGLEGYMLRYLAEHSRLPVPAVRYSSDTLLVMDFIAGDSLLGDAAQAHAADLVADLHGVRGQAFGLERDTLIGGLPQPNPLTDSWLDFFRDHRLLYMGQEAQRAGPLPAGLYARLERLCGRLERWLAEPEYPSLIHGDLWTTNILAANGRITGFLDPAIYYAHPEIELAFSTLFNTFGAAFFRRYQEHRPLAPGFFEERRDLYNLYPLLVHVRLFGGGYVASVDRILRRFGF